MPRATQCAYEGLTIPVERAIVIRDATRQGQRRSIGFTCIECGKPVYPFNGSGFGAAHFEHHRRNEACSLSDPKR